VAGDPTFTVLRSWVDALQAVMPGQLDSTGAVPVFYSHPGDRFAGSALVWLDDISTPSTVRPMRADRARRLITSEFAVVIGVTLEGATAGTELQYEVDTFAASIRTVIDEDVAIEQHLHRPDLVDVAKVLGSETERGLTATGAGCRITMRVSFDARFL
jgi:hypothetical protein